MSRTFYVTALNVIDYIYLVVTVLPYTENFYQIFFLNISFFGIIIIIIISDVTTKNVDFSESVGRFYYI